MREIAWVIENDCMAPPVHYFCGGRGGKLFSRDHMEAVRFTRREDALQALTFFVRHPVQNCYEVREHVWLSPDQAPDAEQGAGWVLVPVEPTEAMIMAMHDGPLMADDHDLDPDNRAWIAKCWRAMVDAS